MFIRLYSCERLTLSDSKRSEDKKRCGEFQLCVIGAPNARSCNH